jgi:phosphomannomutase
MELFSTNDIRGIYSQHWNRDTAYRIGFYLPELLAAKDIVIGRDPRLSSEEIFEAVSDGIQEAGADVIDIGPCCTPSVYFANANFGFGGSVMITASHNPPEYNGFKISGRQAIPIDGSTGLKKLEEMIKVAPRPGRAKGRMRFLDIADSYLCFLQPYKEGIGSLHLISDCSNGAAAYRFGQLVADLPIEHDIINAVPNGRFPQHGPNPLELNNLQQVREKVLTEKADLGVCFDGDGDRIVFIDENGEPISSDYITGLLGLHFLKHRVNGTSDAPKILFDIRSSRSVAEYISDLGALPVVCPVGHAVIKAMLRRERGLYAGELTGHYYFKDFFYCDSALIALLIMLSVLSREKKCLSELVRPLQRYFSSGELSFNVESKERFIEKVRQTYRAGRISELSGLRIDFEDWWFVLRAGSTEPQLRLVIEADNPDLLEQRKTELRSLISKEKVEK